MSSSSCVVSCPGATRLAQRASSAASGTRACATARVSFRHRRLPLVLVPTRAFLGLGGKSKEEKALEEFASTNLGKRAIEHAAKGGGVASMLEFGKKELEAVAVASDGALVDAKTRILCATLINKIVDIPLINESTEQLIAIKAVNVIADYLEKELEKAGINEFFQGVSTMSEKNVDKWVANAGKKVNDAVDLPMLDEDQETIVIEMVLKLIVHKFIKGNEKNKKKGLFGR